MRTENLIWFDGNNYRGHGHGQPWPRSRGQCEDCEAGEAVYEVTRLRIMLKTWLETEESCCFRNDNMKIENSVSGQINDFLFLISPQSLLIEADV